MTNEFLQPVSTGMTLAEEAKKMTTDERLQIMAMRIDYLELRCAVLEGLDEKELNKRWKQIQERHGDV